MTCAKMLMMIPPKSESSVLDVDELSKRVSDLEDKLRKMIRHRHTRRNVRAFSTRARKWSLVANSLFREREKRTMREKLPMLNDEPGCH